MKTPGPDHPIAITASPGRMRVRFDDHVIADTAQALTLQEASYPPVTYFPRGDVETGYMSKTSTVTHCPYKGEATYYSVRLDGRLIEDAAWSYEAPYPAMEQIRGHLAFYPNKLEVYEVDSTELDARRRVPGSGDVPGSA